MKKLSSSDRSALIRLASSLTAQSPMRKAILAGLKKASTEEGGEKAYWNQKKLAGQTKSGSFDGEEESSRLGRPIVIGGVTYTKFWWEVHPLYVQIDLISEEGESVSATSESVGGDLQDGEVREALAKLIDKSLLRGSLPRGFRTSDFS